MIEYTERSESNMDRQEITKIARVLVGDLLNIMLSHYPVVSTNYAELGTHRQAEIKREWEDLIESRFADLLDQFNTCLETADKAKETIASYGGTIQKYEIAANDLMAENVELREQVIIYEKMTAFIMDNIAHVHIDINRNKEQN